MKNEMKIYPFWEMKNHQRLVLRFLPDLNQNNTHGFVDEYFVHFLEVDNKRISTLCPSTHNKGCSHCNYAKRLYMQGNSEHARKYFRILRCSTNALIVEDPLSIGALGSVFQFDFPKSIAGDIRDGLIDLNNLPYDYDKGYNFILSSTRVGEYPRYEGKFQKKKSKLTRKQREIAESSLIDLSKLQPTKLTSDYDSEFSKGFMWDILCESQT